MTALCPSRRNCSDAICRRTSPPAGTPRFFLALGNEVQPIDGVPDQSAQGFRFGPFWVASQQYAPADASCTRSRPIAALLKASCSVRRMSGAEAAPDLFHVRGRWAFLHPRCVDRRHPDRACAPQSPRGCRLRLWGAARPDPAGLRAEGRRVTRRNEIIGRAVWDRSGESSEQYRPLALRCRPPRLRRTRHRTSRLRSIPIGVSKADGDGPVPAVVIMHDCSGLGPRSSGSPQPLGQAAHRARLRGCHPGHFSTRGFPDGVCVPTRRRTASRSGPRCG